MLKYLRIMSWKNITPKFDRIKSFYIDVVGPIRKTITKVRSMLYHVRTKMEIAFYPTLMIVIFFQSASLSLFNRPCFACIRAFTCANPSWKPRRSNIVETPWKVTRVALKISVYSLLKSQQHQPVLRENDGDVECDYVRRKRTRYRPVQCN